MYRLIYIFVILTAITACTSSAVKHKLSTAEEIMTEHPDSALELIQAIDTSDLHTKSEKALYALLLSQALDKNYIDLTSDSIIAEAVDYYSHSDDSYHDMLSQYYLGRIKYNAEDYPRSLVAMFKAHDIAKELNLNFWIAMTARGIADIYTESFNNADAVVYSEIAFDNMKMCNDKRLIVYAMADLVQAYHNNLNYTKGIELAYETLDSLRTMDNSEEELIAHIYRLLGKSHIAIGDYNKSIEFFENLSSTQFMLPSDSAFLGIAYFENSNHQKAHQIFNMIATNIESMSEWLQYKISEYNGNYPGALSALSKMYEKTNESLKVRVQQDLSSSLVSHFNYERDKKQSQLNSARITLYIVIIAGILTILIITILAIRHYNHQKETINHNIAIATNLRDILSLKETECTSAKNSIQELLNTKFDMIDRLCQLYYESESAESTKKRLSNAVSEIIQQLSSDKKKLSQLEELLNTHANNLMIDFRNDFPKLKDVDYRIFLYFSLGFSVNAIALFLNEQKITSIYERKRRIKDKIKKLDEPMKSKYLQYLS